jgi:hypothetical protein
MRLFEWHEGKPPKKSPGQISHGDAARMIDLLDYNFGNVGRKYAAFLGPNRQLVYDATVANSHMFEAAVADPNHNTADERFWIAFACAVLTGAELANAHLGTSFDTPAMKQFLIDKIRQQRLRSYEENTQGGSQEHTEQMLTGFLKAETANTLRTDVTPSGPGRPAPIQVLSNPQQFRPVHVHWVLDATAPQLRFSQAELYRWLRQPEVGGDPRSMKEGLKKHFAATVAKGTLGQGTNFRVGAEQVVTVPVTSGSALWNIMTAYAPPTP